MDLNIFCAASYKYDIELKLTEIMVIVCIPDITVDLHLSFK